MELNSEFEVDRPIDETWLLLTDVERIAPCLPGAQLEEIEGEEYRGSVKIKVGPITANYKGKATFVEKDDQAHRAVLRAEGRDARQGNANATITAQLISVGTGTKVTVATDLAVTGKVAQFGRGVMAEVSTKLLNQFVKNLETKVLSQPAAREAVGSASTPASGSAPATPTAASLDSAPAAAPAPSTASATPASVSSTPTSAADPVPGAAPAASGPASSSGSVGSSGPAAGSNNGAPSPAGPTVRKIAPTGPVEPVDLLGATGAPMLKRLAPVLAAVVALLLALRWLRRRRG